MAGGFSRRQMTARRACRRPERTRDSHFSNGAPVTAAAIDPAGRRIVTGGRDGAVRVWRFDASELASYLRGATTACLATADRMKLLEEDERTARRAFESCERRNGRAPVR